MGHRRKNDLGKEKDEIKEKREEGVLRKEAEKNGSARLHFWSSFLLTSYHRSPQASMFIVRNAEGQAAKAL